MTVLPPPGRQNRMNGGQIAALIFAILLLLPGGCFVLFGIAFLNGLEGNSPTDPSLLMIGLAILAVAVALFGFAFYRRRPAGGPPQGGADGPAA